MEASLSQWRQYKQSAESGEFRMDEQLGGALKKRCDTPFLSGLEKDLLRMAGDLGQLSGFGTLPSAEALRQKFQNKAVSDADSAVNQLMKHIELVSLMRDTYALAIRKLTDQDQANANGLNQTQV
ncbi:hypothetical protein [Nocardia puris]|uniref:Excreted virulence factor EspC (Type VII ESX diderm) n=1 Tax=Nocardia puris TaxID=208602 RepID=A0A366DLE4_9NOCA|nr:hypothetical protein [Nocardia puris]RBO90902.1 hypothetical protein DFR74_105308 [Nocardia puris]